MDDDAETGLEAEQDDAPLPAPAPSPPATPASKADKRALDRLIAYADFKRLPAAQRTTAELYRQYVQRRRAGDQTVPTNNRETLYLWAKEGEWLKRVAEEELALQQAQDKALLHDKTRQGQVMAAMWMAANKRLLDLIENGDDKIAIVAIQDLFDRTGLPKASRIQTSRQDREVANGGGAPLEAPQEPAESAPDAEWQRYAAERLRYEQQQG